MTSKKKIRLQFAGKAPSWIRDIASTTSTAKRSEKAQTKAFGKLGPASGVRALSPIAALRAILADPGGCVYCDSGTLRRPPAYPHATQNSQHEPTCGFYMAQQILEVETSLAAMKG